MRWLSRPALLVVLVSAGLAVIAVALWPRAPEFARPLPVAPGDQEIVWLSPATNVRDWERFVTAVLKARPEGLQLRVDDSRAFPRETTEVPEIRLAVAGKTGGLVFRWYKITGDHKISDWVRDLARRDPPPLALIGGNTSHSALELARRLQASQRGPHAPLFFITQATADKDPADASQVRLPLPGIYKDRTFRFCFNNRQMARAVTEFVWNRDNLLPASAPLRQGVRFIWDADPLPPAEETLRPDAGPAYMPIWDDDPYSQDLADSFALALEKLAVRSSLLDWSWLAGCAATGGAPLDLARLRRGRFGTGDTLTWSDHIFHGVGGFNRANRAEEQCAENLLEEVDKHRHQLRPLLVLPATSQPSRRFLRALRRKAPVIAKRFVVVTGDSIEFNKIYRDRNLTWPIQEVPLKLVFFCHRNPVDKAVGFHEQNEVAAYDPNRGAPTSGTEDLLLFIDMVETTVKAAYQGERLLAEARELARRLHRARWKGGPLLFDALGNRRSGTGEHIVYLRPPVLKEGRVAPRAELEVWARNRSPEETGPKTWALVRYLAVTYEGGIGEGGQPYGPN
jgi:hypothetical protein